jgi:hypothetical protein
VPISPRPSQTPATSSWSASRKRLNQVPLRRESVLPEAFPIKPSDKREVIFSRPCDIGGKAIEQVAVEGLVLKLIEKFGGRTHPQIDRSLHESVV